MMALVCEALRKKLPKFGVTKEAINCHHNYVAWETHFGESVWITRKGAIGAGEGELGIIPGSDGGEILYCARQRQPTVVCFLFTRGGQSDEPHRRQETIWQ